MAFSLRLITLQSRPLSLDETYSVWFATRPWLELWHVVPLYETHPPMYYSLLKVWTQWFGTSEPAVRLLSVAASMATVLLVATSGKLLRAGPAIDRVGLVAALLLATNKGNILFAELARPYALETLAASLAILCSVIVLRHLTVRTDGISSGAPMRDAATRDARTLLWPALIGLTLSAGATLWSHNTAILVVFGIGFGLAVSTLLWAPGSRLRLAVTIAAPFAVALLLWSPYMGFLLLQSKHVQSSFWIALNWSQFPTAWSLAAGGKLPLVPIVLLCACGYVALWRASRPIATHLAILLLVPFLLTVAISYFIRPIFIDRLFEWMVTPIMYLAALGLVFAMPRNWSRLASLVLVVLLAGAQIVQFYRLQPDEDWRASVAEVADHYRSGDLLVLSPNEVQVAVAYYAKKFARFPDLLVVPSPFPAMGLDRQYVSNFGTPEIAPADRDIVKAALATHRRVWLIQRGAQSHDPDSVVRNEILSLRKPKQVHGDETPEAWPELFE